MPTRICRHGYITAERNPNWNRVEVFMKSSQRQRTSWVPKTNIWTSSNVTCTERFLKTASSRSTHRLRKRMCRWSNPSSGFCWPFLSIHPRSDTANPWIISRASCFSSWAKKRPFGRLWPWSQRSCHRIFMMWRWKERILIRMCWCIWSLNDIHLCGTGCRPVSPFGRVRNSKRVGCQRALLWQVTGSWRSISTSCPSNPSCVSGIVCFSKFRQEVKRTTRLFTQPFFLAKDRLCCFVWLWVSSSWMRATYWLWMIHLKCFKKFR